ncbi:capsular exopolysaccharide family [Stanieria cyanosphaera PCC 7437]|uniref:non-specific protein-tyrosine kinase n=1 Tax=Stanieria cyanosphaera (strain ATCC 29371 / PCC 7437) TaxID=111780 RepID=K9XYR6_STAC7|nr:polysaccharide biosynthesis tyrosine autokinase [Stanieria cyanosphaera]AFZ37653.1 capsular exopolysaccharide family [Stanieria cyanosphaera PCC 7437]
MESTKINHSTFEPNLIPLVIKRRWLPALTVFTSILTLGIIATNFKKPIYSASGELLYKRVNPTYSLINPAAEHQESSYNLKSDPLTTQSEILRSKPVVKETLAQLNWQDEKGKPIKPEQFLENFDVKNLTGTDILSVSYQSQNPQKAAEATNTLISVFLQQNIAANRAELVAARKFLEEQLPKAQATVANAELALRNYKEKNKIVSLETEAPKIVELVNRIQQQIIDSKAEIAKISNESNTLKQKLGMDSNRAALITNLSQSPAVQEVLQQLQQVESELAQEKSRYTDNNPKIVELTEKVQSLKSLLNQRIQQISGDRVNLLYGNLQNGQLQQELTSNLIQLEATNRGLVNQIAELSQIETDYQKRINTFPRLEQQLKALQRELEVSQSTYALLLQKFQEVRIAENQNTGDFRVVSEAVVPAEPVPYKAISYLASGLLATLVAVGTIYLLEILDKSIKTLEEAKQIFGYTWLGIIPAAEQSKLPELSKQEVDPLIPKLFVRDYSAFAISESYRMLQSNLRFLSCDQKIKTIVVTSSVSQEGKSTISANLAAAMAQVGHRVLLIDAHLHHPIQHRIWDLYNNCGLSNLIAEQINPSSAIKEVMLNLDVLPSGVIPPSPVTLLDSQKMINLIDFFATRYDFVIIDTPALNFAPDASIIGRITDGILLVVKPGVVDQTNAKFTKELLEQSGQNVLGIVVNGVSPTSEPHGYYYHSLEHRLTKEQPKLLGQPKEELWETISRLARESKQKTSFNSTVNLEELDHTPIEKLKEIVNQFQRDLDILTKLVKEQEEELSLQRQTVKRLQRKLNIATDQDRFTLEQKLAQEQEIRSMLDETLVGQRRNLEKRKEILRQYQQILSLRQTSLKE